MKTIEKIFDIETGEEQIIERDMTPEELSAYQEAKLEAEKKAAELTQKESAKKAILEKLGLTEEEAKLLLG